jgi:hypothetical protein
MAIAAVPNFFEFDIIGSIELDRGKVKFNSLPIQDEPEGWL